MTTQDLIQQWRIAAELATTPEACATYLHCAKELEGSAVLPRTPQQEQPIVAVVDGRCSCEKCRARTENIYRMIGVCYNCGAKPILMLFRAGDPTAELDCPVCGKWRGIHSQRLATPDEIPDTALAGTPEERSHEAEADSTQTEHEGQPGILGVRGEDRQAGEAVAEVETPVVTTPPAGIAIRALLERQIAEWRRRASAALTTEPRSAYAIDDCADDLTTLLAALLREAEAQQQGKHDALDAASKAGERIIGLEFALQAVEAERDALRAHIDVVAANIRSAIHRVQTPDDYISDKEMLEWAEQLEHLAAPPSHPGGTLGMDDLSWLPR